MTKLPRTSLRFPKLPKNFRINTTRGPKFTNGGERLPCSPPVQNSDLSWPSAKAGKVLKIFFKAEHRDTHISIQHVAACLSHRGVVPTQGGQALRSLTIVFFINKERWRSGQKRESFRSEKKPKENKQASKEDIEKTPKVCASCISVERSGRRS